MICWMINEKKKESFFAGTLTPQDSIKAEIVAWYNYKSPRDIEDMINPRLIIKAGNIEDAVILPFLKVRIDNVWQQTHRMDEKSIFINIRSSFSGKANEGDFEKDKENYKTISIEIDTEGRSIKANDLKNLYFEIIAG